MYSPLLSFQVAYEILTCYRFVVVLMGVNTFYYVIYGLIQSMVSSIKTWSRLQLH